MTLDNWSPLTEIALEQPLVLDIISYTWTNAATLSSEIPSVQSRIDSVMPSLLLVFRDTDAVTFLKFSANFIKNLPSEVVPPILCMSDPANIFQTFSQNPKWLHPLTLMIRKLVTIKPTPASRSAYTQLSAAILQAFPEISPDLLFRDEGTAQGEKKPFSYLFINLLLIDLRSSFPTLLEKLNSSDYPDISARLAAAFDVLSSYIGFLVRSLDIETNSPLIQMSPDLILKLRKDISETISLTIEYLRDRWDASIAGAAGLHPGARTTSSASGAKRLTLTWESKTDSVKEDPLVLAGIRALAIWISEDENESLRNECAGIMDMFMDLYQASAAQVLDFRYPILLALEGIVTNEDGMESFLNHDGWQIISKDLESILAEVESGHQFDNPSTSHGVSRGLEIVRVLISVTDQWNKGALAESSMKVVTLTGSMKVSSSPSSPKLLELQIAMLQLSVALLSKAHDGMRKRYKASTDAILVILKGLQSKVRLLDDKTESIELLSLLEDVSLDLENL